MAQAAPGWYNDGSGRLRHWNGEEWGEYAAVVQAAPKSPANRNAAPAFGLGLAGLLLAWAPFVGFVLGAAGVALGVITLAQNSKVWKRGGGLAVWGVLLGLAALTIGLVVIVAQVARNQ